MQSANDTDVPFCARCTEEFPIKDGDPWQMGAMRRLRNAPQRIQRQMRDWVNSELHGEGYLCGNCYFDLTD